MKKVTLIHLLKYQSCLKSIEVSKSTVYRFLIMNGFKLTSPIKANELTQNQKLARVEWYKKYKYFDWNSVVKLFHCSFRNSPIHFGEKIEFSFLLVENLTVSPQGLSSILRFPCGEIIENLFLLNENSNSSLRRWEKLWSELCINCIYRWSTFRWEKKKRWPKKGEKI